jgi:hypothetical protein
MLSGNLRVLFRCSKGDGVAIDLEVGAAAPGEQNRGPDAAATAQKGEEERHPARAPLLLNRDDEDQHPRPY